MASYLLSNVIFLIAFSATIPQLYQTVSTGKTRDLNVWNLGLNMFTNVLLGFHGYYQADFGLLAIGVWFTLFWGTLLALKVNNLRRCASF
jgi:hypothetical protein